MYEPYNTLYMNSIELCTVNIIHLFIEISIFCTVVILWALFLGVAYSFKCI